MVDKALLLRKMAELEVYLGQIREYSNINVKKYSEDWKTQRIVERTLQMMIEICVDTASHIISDEGYRVPKSYVDTYRVLYENEIIDEELFERMEKMAKFRNIVVHHYDKVDEGRVPEYWDGQTAARVVKSVKKVLNKNFPGFERHTLMHQKTRRREGE